MSNAETVVVNRWALEVVLGRYLLGDTRNDGLSQAAVQKLQAVLQAALIDGPGAPE